MAAELDGDECSAGGRWLDPASARGTTCARASAALEPGSVRPPTTSGIKERAGNSFWWKDIVLLQKFKDLASATVSDGSTVLLWEDTWNGQVPAIDFP